MRSDCGLTKLRPPGSTYHVCRRFGRLHGWEIGPSDSPTCVPNVETPNVETLPNDYLKLYTSPASPSPTVPGCEGSLTEIESLCRAFTAATGQRLRFLETADIDFDPDLEWSAPVISGDGASPGQLRLDRVRKVWGPRQADADVAAQEFLSGLADLLSAKQQASTALVNREAELATCIPVVPHYSESAQLAERLTAVLQSGAESLDCQAAAVYLLDDATSQLKLRSSWGLPEGRLADPPRSLAGAIADLEALAGHAVVLENDLLFDSWQVPERCGAAVCVPISTPTTILGTLWLFSNQARDFDSEETNLVEILAGRIASDLERDVLLREGQQSQTAKHELSAAAEYVEESQPNMSPLLEGWEIARRTLSANDGETLGSQLLDWRATDNDSLDLAVARMSKPGLRSAMQTVALRAAWRAEVGHDNEPARLLDRLTTTFDGEIAKGELAAIANVHIDAELPLVHLAMAGDVGVLLRRGESFTWLPDVTHLPNADQSSPFAYGHKIELEGDDVLVLVANPSLAGCRQAILDGLFQLSTATAMTSAAEVADGVTSLLRSLTPGKTADGGVLALRARG